MYLLKACDRDRRTNENRTHFPRSLARWRNLLARARVRRVNDYATVFINDYLRSQCVSVCVLMCLLVPVARYTN